MSFWTSVRNTVENANPVTVAASVLAGGNPLKNITNNSLATNINDAAFGKPPSSSSVDPFGAYRGNYINMLNGLMGVSYGPNGQVQNSSAGGAALTSLPGQQKNIQMTAEGINRAENAHGFGGSGNAAYALAGAGNTLGTQAYSSQYGLLSALSGAQAYNPTAIASLQGQQAALNQSTLGGIGSLAGLGIGAAIGGPAGAAAGSSAGGAIGQMA